MSAAPPTEALGNLQQAAEKIPEDIRSRLRIAEAFKAAAKTQIDLSAQWTTEDIRILDSVAPLQPIETFEELIDAATAAVEHCEDPNTVERIISGIVRLYRERPAAFDSMTKSLRKRGCSGIWDAPVRGIAAGYLGISFGSLLGAWLEVEPADDDCNLISDCVDAYLDAYLDALARRVRAGTATPLLSEATQIGGWIDPRVWVERLIRIQTNGTEVDEQDLVRSLLRLTPDGRDEALVMCDWLQPPLKPMATAALGGEVEIDNAVTPQVWITALRARDPCIDLCDHLTPEEQAALPEELKSLPDVIHPADYQWSVRERTDNTTWQGTIESWPTREDRSGAQSAAELFKEQLLRAVAGGEAVEDDDLALAMKAVTQAEPQSKGSDLLTVALHHLSCKPSPPYTYPYMALQWPRKLDWYWCLATKGLSKRVEAGSSVEEPYGRFLLPLLAQDQPLTRMAARALWIATVSKDPNSRCAAVEAWIALIDTDRIDLATVAAALQDTLPGGWVKLNRMAEVLAEVAVVSPLCAWAVAQVLEAYLVPLDSLPRGIAPLLELLDECCRRLGLAAREDIQPILKGINSGKAKAAARSLLARTDEPTADRRTAVAVAVALQARMARAQRMT